MKQINWLIAMLCVLGCSPEMEDVLDVEQLQKEKTCQGLIDEHVEEHDGTACCSSPTGIEYAYPGDTLTFEYTTNIPHAEVSWVILSGSITIIEGVNSKEAVFVFNDDFSGGAIQGRGRSTNDELVCSDGFVVESLN